MMPDKRAGDGDKDQNRPNLDEHDHAIDGRRFLYADNQDGGDRRNHEKRDYIKDGRGVRQ